MSQAIRNQTWQRQAVAALVLLTHLAAVLHPTASWALTSGPSQPEFTSFEPVVTTHMVNEFSGDFTYNIPVLEIPGPDGSGYALSLSYHSGATPEEEASWVGSGWTLNPGAINRQMIGVPDDWNGEQMKYLNVAPQNTTISVSGPIQPELMSYEVPIGVNGTIRYNNYTGFGYSAGAGIQFCSGVVSLGFNLVDGNGTFSLSVNPAAALNKRREELSTELKDARDQLKNTSLSSTDKAKLESTIKSLTDKLDKNKKRSSQLNKLSKITRQASAYGMHAIESGTFPMNGHNMEGDSWALGIGLNVTVAPIELGVQGNVVGTLSQQRNMNQSILPTYGYLYQNEALDANAVMDYHTDNASTYNKRDKHLPQSYNDIDQFVATGEGIMGSMQFHADHATTNRPARTVGTTQLNQIGVEVNLGLSLGMSFDTYVVGTQELIQGSWSSGHSSNSPRTSEPYFLRMVGDKGGYVQNGTGAAPVNSHVAMNGLDIGYRNGSYQIPSSSNVTDLGTERSGRSSHVGFTLYKDINKPGWRYERAPANSYVNDPISPTEITSLQDQIAEISILNENGQRYNYALPVRASKDENISMYHTANDAHNYVYTGQNISSNSDFITGSKIENNASYATAFLLTSILQPDYIDRFDDGPTVDDIGGFTKFYYEKLSNNYTWRSPYIGYRYSDTELSECYDNRAQFSKGEKEIKYLKRIETKSHVAIFNRSNRQDGKGAGTGTLQKLDRIDLYLRSDIENNGSVVNGAVPLRSIHFKYYDAASGVWPGVPNHNSPNGSKLTLKKVYFTTNGTNPAQIAPYEFSYRYGGAEYGDHPSAELFTCPNYNDAEYSEFCTDPWGNYRSDGPSRYGSHKPWLDQTPDLNVFDAAAWQLKRISLPSGGEIHVQYEQDDYAYVQNEKAHAMVPLAGWHSANTDEFLVDVSELLGSSTPGAPVPFTWEEIIQQLREIYTDPSGPRRKIFYKIMYLFEDYDSSCDDVNNRHREFMTGYSTVVSNGIQPGALPNTIKIKLESNSRPQKICQQQFRAEKKGKNRDGNCVGSSLASDGPDTDGSEESAIRNFFSNAGSYIASGVTNNCDKICEMNSFFRIPVGERKLGGGIRVKRLMMVDPTAIENGYPAVFGTEYIYKTTDERGRIISSGVAANEPGGLREENVLVRPLDRYRQTFASRMVAGPDRKQVEGPIGASVYPGASVGYSKVIARSIHDGRTAPAFTVNQFHTFKDHPVHSSMTETDRQNDYLPATTGIVNIVRNSIYASQGYAIHIPDMHGKPARQAAYNGDYRAVLNWNGVFANLISSVETEYFGKDEQLPIMAKPDGEVVGSMISGFQPLGQEVNVCMETREIRDRMNNGTVELDTDVSALIIPFPSASAMVTVSHTLTKAATHTITKVVRYPAIVKRTRTFKDGIYHVTQNIAFDPQTGNPTVVRSHDGFFPIADLQAAQLNEAEDGVYTTVSIPGSMVYENLGQAAAGERKAFISFCGIPDATQCIECTIANGNGATLQITNPTIPEGAQSSCGVPAGFCIGDRLHIRTTNNDHYYHLSGIENNDLHLIRDGGSDALVAEDNIMFIQILRSGCSNKLNESAGNFTYYGIPNQSGWTEMQERQNFVYHLNHMLAVSVSGGMEYGICDLNYEAPNLAYPAPGDPVCAVYDPQCGSDISILPDNVIGFGLSENYLIHYNWNQNCVQIGLGIWDCPIIQIDQVNITTPNEMCGKFSLPYPGQFALDENGMLIYQLPNSCPPEPLECPQFCGPIQRLSTITNVVSSSATTYEDKWDYATAEYATNDQWPGQRNEYELGKRGKWRPKSAYTYMSPLTPGTKNYDQGMYDMVLFNYSEPLQNNNTPWKLSNLITHYSPEGNVLQELDALGKPSSAKFGYDKMLPTLVAQNSPRSLVQFESFEKQYGTATPSLEDGVVFSSTDWPATGRNQVMSHSGQFSYRSSAAQGVLYRSSSMAIPSTAQSLLFGNRRMLVKCWVNAYDASGPKDPTDLSCRMVDISGTNSAVTVPMERVARTGHCVQYSVEMPVGSDPTQVRFEIRCTNAPGTTTAIDDVRIQPVDAQMTTYVYDAKTLRLLATFDDQHFGLYYQYNGEGKLVRKQIETERGLKTVQENLQNTPLSVP